MSDFNDMLRLAFADAQGSSAFSLDRDRPYDGQPHTDQGERGRTLVEGLTMRDVSDCIVLGFLDAAGIKSEHPVHDDIYHCEDIDYGAVIQNAMCHVERMMGIFPNLPPLTPTEAEECTGCRVRSDEIVDGLCTDCRMHERGIYRPGIGEMG